ncbi:MAG: DUF2393 domain-containing protein [Bryobacteraceae bacterium]|nr:DUF2393 domain-containing protein [Bryobacteraceae bacterium]
MRFPLYILAAMLVLTAQDKKKAPKPPEMEIVSARGHRSGDSIHFDGTVRNTGTKPLEKVLILVDVFAPNHKPMVQRKSLLEPEYLAPGDEADFHLAMPDPGQLVEFELQAEDGKARELRVAKNGPFPIE